MNGAAVDLRSQVSGMLKQILFVHWRGSNLLLLPLVVATFAAPVLAVQPVAVSDPGLEGAWAAVGFLEASRKLVPLFPGLAAAVGIVLGLTAWSWDHKHGHVYALALPVPRWRYALLKLEAGALLLLVPALFFWAGALLAAGSVALPEGIHAYPTALAGRFLLAALVAYGAAFAFAAGTIRTTVTTLSLGLGGVVLGAVVVDLLAGAFPVLETVSVVPWVVDAFGHWPGPFEAFSGSWTLFDV